MIPFVLWLTADTLACIHHEQCQMGDPMDEETDIGAVISKSQLQKINAYIDHGSKEKVPSSTS